ncbi:MAG: preprotein translocase subunit SecE [Deltaproteobacteria bacterium]
MSNNRMVVLFWVGATLCVGIFFERVLSDFLFRLIHASNPTVLFDWSLSLILGMGLALAIGIGTWMQPRLRELALECAQELNKTTWPSRAETQTQTVAVLVATAVFAGILGIFDAIGLRVMTGWLPHAIEWVARLGH